MNRTEHKLRMAFDPDYETRWEILTLYRKARRRELIDLLKRLRYLLPLYTLSITFYIAIIFYAYTRSLPLTLYVVLLLPVAILIGIAMVYFRDDILFRKRLGI